MNSELILGGDYYVGDLVVGQEQRVGTIKIGSTTYNRYVKIVDCGVVPDTTTKSVAHGITGIVGLLNYRLVAKSTSLAYLVVTYSTNTDITCYCTNTNIVIITTDNYSSLYTSSYAILEYYK